MRRSSDALAALFGIRRGGHDLLRCASGVMDAEMLLSRANLLADKLECARQRVVIPSDEPISLLAGIAGCWLGNNTAVAWRKAALGLDTLAELTAAAISVRWDQLHGDWQVERLSPDFDDSPPGDLIVLTSGSTGKPKGVALDLGRVVANAALAGSRVEVASTSFWAVDADMSLMSPLGHTFMAWTSQVTVQHLGGMDWRQRDEVFESGSGGYGGTPLQIREIAQRITGRGPRVIVSSGDFLPPALGASVDQRFPQATLHKIYGLTEVSGRLCILRHDERVHDPAAAGYPLPGFGVSVEKTDEGGDFGEICVSAPTMMHGYWRQDGFDPALPAFFRTGDLGSMRADGLVTVTGRRDDVFKVGAEKVDRHSIEEVLQRELAGHEFCVLPVVHPVLGQTPALFVGSNETERMPSRAAIVGAVKSKLPARYVPTMILWVGATLPKLPNGKLDKQLLIVNFSKFADLYASRN
jgi:acyl-CoA synthetase (AMP-forming)/AMP-acid ligase II